MCLLHHKRSFSSKHAKTGDRGKNLIQFVRKKLQPLPSALTPHLSHHAWPLGFVIYYSSRLQWFDLIIIDDSQLAELLRCPCAIEILPFENFIFIVIS